MEAYERWAADYDEISRRSGWHGPEILFGLMYEYLAPGQTVLDIGIGTGLGSALFHTAGLRVSGIDNSEKMLGCCRAKGFVHELKQHDLGIGGWPYEEGRFDHTVSCAVFHFFRDLEVLFRETARVMKPGGTFGFTVIETPDKPDQFNDPDSGIVVYRHNRAGLAELFKRHAFSLEKRVTFIGFRDVQREEPILFTGYIIKKTG